MSQFDLPTVFCEIDLLGQRERDRANVPSTRESKYKPLGSGLQQTFSSLSTHTFLGDTHESKPQKTATKLA